MVIDETGNCYGRWTVVKRAKNNKGGAAVWLCRCECGTERNVTGLNLRSGHSKSCGCLHREIAGNHNFVDLTKQRYGRLTIIGRKKSNSDGRATWLCICDCGQKITVTGHNLLSGNTRSCGCLWKDTVRLPKGEAAFNTLVNRYKIDAKRRNLEWTLKTEEVRIITKQACYYCGATPAQIRKSKTFNGVYTYNGIDRIDHNIGYFPNNVVPCCKRCNYAKHVMSVVEFKGWIVRV